jgi:hypothetical protein
MTRSAAPRRWLTLLASLAAAALAPAARGQGCPPFRELHPPRIVRDGSVVWLHRSLDPDWFSCVRKAGGKLSGRSEVRRGGSWDLDSESSSIGPKIRLGAWASNYCGRSGKRDPDQLRFVLEGKGPLAEASWTSEGGPALCGCSRRSEARLEAKAGPEGLQVSFTVDAAWLACAPRPGDTLELRAYLGAGEREAVAQAAPAAVLAGLERGPVFHGTLPWRALCAGGARVAVLELAGRGALGQLTGEGQQTVALDCRGQKQQ